MALRASRPCTSVKLRFIPSSLNIATWNPAFWLSSALEVPANPQPPTDNRPPHRKHPMLRPPVSSGHALASAATGRGRRNLRSFLPSLPGCPVGGEPEPGAPLVPRAATGEGESRNFGSLWAGCVFQIERAQGWAAFLTSCCGTPKGTANNLRRCPCDDDCLDCGGGWRT
jgi:hypothetical protein